MEEDKALICRKMFDLLSATQYYSHIKSMTYVYNWDDDKHDRIYKTAPAEYVLVKFKDGGRSEKVIDVSSDSGYAMIHDVLRYI